jgi:multiple sugar transport system permease protein
MQQNNAVRRGPAVWPIPARRYREAVETAGLNLFALALAIVFLLPLLWMVATSLKPTADVMSQSWLGSHLAWSNYRVAVSAQPYLLWMRNTVLIAVANVAGAVLSSLLVAYGITKVRWFGSRLVFGSVLGTMMIPYQVVMIPLFIVFRNLGWINTYYPLTVPSWFGVPLYIFLARQFLLTIPKEFSEAAVVDGASHLWIFLRVMMPLSKPVIVSIAIFQFLASWSDFLGPLIYLNSSDLYTLSLGVAQFVGQYYTQWNVFMAAAFLMVVPVLVVFFALQRYFVQGIVLSGLKG